jgi:alpha-L-fucosidase
MNRIGTMTMVALVVAGVGCMSSNRRTRDAGAVEPTGLGGTGGATGGAAGRDAAAAGSGGQGGATGGTGGSEETGGSGGEAGTGGAGGTGGSIEVPDAAPPRDAALPRDAAPPRDAARDSAPDVARDTAPITGPAAVRPLPTRDQAAYQRLERIAFFHYGTNTYTGAEVGDGNADPSVFDPSDLDANQWMTVLKSAGFKLAMMTAKHHDGFSMWPTKCSDYNVSKSPYRGGNGDVVKDFVEAARAAGIKPGIYLSPWDTHGADSSGAQDYFDRFKCMLTELLSDYGDIAEVWFDGNNAPQGDWVGIVALVRSLQPRAVIQMGPEIATMTADIRWVGNESGIAPNGTASVQERNGTPVWYPAECDVSIRPGWFYHADQDDQVKSLDELLRIYFSSIGRNCPLLLNVPPDQRGRIADPDVERMKEFGAALDQLFKTNLAMGQAATADSTFKDAPDFEAARAVDDDLGTYWAAGDGQTAGRLELDLGAARSIKVVSIQEPIELGERSTRYHVEIQAAGATTWTTIGSGTVIGTRNLIRLNTPRMAQKVALVIEDARGVPAIAEFAVY